MSTEDDLLRPKRRRLAEAVEGSQKDQDGRQKAYYGMLETRLDSLLREIGNSGTASEDDLVRRLRALHTEVSRQVGKGK